MNLRRFLKKLYGYLPFVRPREARQYGAIPYRVTDGEVQVLIITSRGTGRWIFPKGKPMSRRTPWQAAAQEAYEEAGVRGDIESAPLGSYVTIKTYDPRQRPVYVDLYPLRVTEELADWPERAERRRQWVDVGQAQRLLSDPRLAEATRALARRESGAQ